MEQVESLLSVITFILKSINPGQVDDMDIEMLKSFSLSHLVIAENLRSINDDNLNAANEEEKTCEANDSVDIEEKEMEMLEESISLQENTPKEMNSEKPGTLETAQRETLLKANLIVFRCLFCEIDFREEEDFYNHDSEKHVKDGKFHCVCNEGFSDKKDAVHHFMAEHKKKNSYPCRECTESLFGKQELKTHLKDVHAITVKPHQCPVCLDNVRHNTTKDGLRNHMYKEHRTVQFKCDICESILTSKTGLEKHKMQLHSDEKIKYTCDKCSKDYYNKNSYESHVAKHNGEPAFACDKCSKKFYTSYYLKTHGYDHKNENKKLYCTQCDYSTTYRYTLKRHTRTVHSDVRPFSCNTCDSTYKTRDTLLLHTKIHTGEKPHQCKYCEKTFTQSKHLKNHVAIHEKNYRFECKVCERKFIQNGNFKLHMRKHHHIEN